MCDVVLPEIKPVLANRLVMVCTLEGSLKRLLTMYEPVGSVGQP